MLLDQTTFAFPVSAFPPLAVGFFGLGTGYLIYGPQELFGFPRRSPAVDRSTGLWGIWMPGFMQFITGVMLFVGLVWFHSFTEGPLYMAALAFTAYGVHWFAIGGGRYVGGDPQPNAFMSIAFTMISVLGIVVFFLVGDWPVGVLFCGLTLIYISDFFASLKIGVRGATAPGDGQPVGPPTAEEPPLGGPTPPGPRGGALTAERLRLGAFVPHRHQLATAGGSVNLGERSLGFWHLLTGLWLMYLTWATALNLATGQHLPL